MIGSVGDRPSPGDDMESTPARKDPLTLVIARLLLLDLLKPNHRWIRVPLALLFVATNLRREQRLRPLLAVGSRASDGECVEAFVLGLSLVSKDFRPLTIRTNVVRTRSRWFGSARSFLVGIQGKSVEVTARDGARATLTCLLIPKSAKTVAP